MKSAIIGLLTILAPVELPAQATAPSPQMIMRTPDAPPDTASVTPSERQKVIAELATSLEANYVFPDIAAKYATTLRANLAKGAYDNLSDATLLADKVTADLQAIAPDGHLRLATRSAFMRHHPPQPGAALSTQPKGPAGLEEAKMIDNVAYLRFNEFLDDPKQAEAARQFLIKHARAEAVIIDVRPNRGGRLTVIDAILPLLYSAKTTLLRTEVRASAAEHIGSPTSPTLVLQRSRPEVVTSDHIVTPDASHTGLQHVPVYYLISGRSASAAEHLALALKRSHRATLIGQTTAGAGHIGGIMPIGDRFAVFMPVGRTFDPVTGWDWEGKGVAPDVPTTANDALSTALGMIRSPRSARPTTSVHQP